MRKVNSRGRFLPKALACFMSVVLAMGVMWPGSLVAYAQEGGHGNASSLNAGAFETQSVQTQSTNAPATSLTLAGKQVNGSSADIFGDGTASFDAATGTLTLRDFAATGNNGGTDNILNVPTGNLVLELHGNNSLIAGTNYSGVWVKYDLTITGDGNLAATGGYHTKTHNADGICVDGSLAFSSGFTGTVVATGGWGNKESVGIFCAEGLAIHGGTVIASGGYGDTSAGVEVTKNFGDCLGLIVDGGTLVAQGGNGGNESYGIWEVDSKSSFEDGVSIVRSGLQGGQLNYYQLAAFGGDAPEINTSTLKVAAKMGYVDGAFKDTTDRVGEYSYTASGKSTYDTGVVIVPKSYGNVDDFSDLPDTLTNDVYHVSTSQANFGDNVTDAERSLRLNGYQAVFVDLYESSVSNDVQAGAIINADAYSLSGDGQLVSVGGIAKSGTSNGLYASGSLVVDGPKVTCVAAASGASKGYQANGSVTVEDGSFVGVGGTAYKFSSGNSSGICANSIANADASILGVGGTAFGLGSSVINTSCGLEGEATANERARVMGVGGMGVAGSSFAQSKGISGVVKANGGVVSGLGAYSGKYSIGCNSGMIAYPGAKVVGLGGVVPDPEGGNYGSYGSWASPSESYGGEQLVAGRTMPYCYQEADKDKKFYACANNAKGNAYTDYEGTEGKTAVDYDTTQETISTFKRVEINKKATAPVKVALPEGKSFTYDGKSHTGVAAGTGYTLSGTKSATNAGSYTATATLNAGYAWEDGNTSDARKVTWKINPKKVTPTFALAAASYTWNGGVKTPAVTVKAKIGSKTYTLKKGTDYDVAYASGRKNVGAYKVTVTRKGGNFTFDKKALTFKINPKGATAKAPAAASKALTVKWAKQAKKMSSARVTGYEVQAATNKAFTKGLKKATVKGYASTSKKLTGLKAKTAYYVRVRTYMKVGKATYYSPWSTYSKAVKTK